MCPHFTAVLIHRRYRDFSALSLCLFEYCCFNKMLLGLLKGLVCTIFHTIAQSIDQPKRCQHPKCYSALSMQHNHRYSSRKCLGLSAAQYFTYNNKLQILLRLLLQIFAHLISFLRFCRFVDSEACAISF